MSRSSPQRSRTGAVAEPQQEDKKDESGDPQFSLVENPDILATIARRNAERPSLVIGFAAETENVMACKEKLRRKG